MRIVPSTRSADEPAAGTNPGEPIGDLRGFVKAYRAHIPGARSHAYVDPTEDDVGLVVGALVAALQGSLAAAALALRDVGYRLVLHRDPATQGEHIVVYEAPPCVRCWGMYVLNRSPSSHDVLVEAPHPVHDRLTPELGIGAYLELNARAFLMAGAHRYANGFPSLVSDMARNPRSVFQRVHEALTDGATHVVQMHGFCEDDYPGYPGILVSNGSAAPDSWLFELQAALAAHGEAAGVYDGVRWRQLGGLMNPQGLYTRTCGGRFYHMEHELALRRDPQRRRRVVLALRQVLNGKC